MGLRLRVRTDPRRHRRRRATDQSPRPGLEAGLPLRSRPGDRHAGVADRRDEGAAVPDSRRTVGADAAHPELATALRAAGPRPPRPHRPDARATGGGTGGRQRVEDRPALRSADP